MSQIVTVSYFSHLVTISIIEKRIFVFSRKKLKKSCKTCRENFRFRESFCENFHFRENFQFREIFRENFFVWKVDPDSGAT
jgi:hypothetical protein